LAFFFLSLVWDIGAEKVSVVYLATLLDTTPLNMRHDSIECSKCSLNTSNEVEGKSAEDEIEEKKKA
jgi:hypothetical protein